MRMIHNFCVSEDSTLLSVNLCKRYWYSWCGPSPKPEHCDCDTPCSVCEPLQWGPPADRPLSGGLTR